MVLPAGKSAVGGLENGDLTLVTPKHPAPNPGLVISHLFFI